MKLLVIQRTTTKLASGKEKVDHAVQAGPFDVDGVVYTLSYLQAMIETLDVAAADDDRRFGGDVTTTHFLARVDWQPTA